MSTARRTLVKSPPELWAEVSDAAALARHLGEFGEIRITRLEPEKTVVWEGEHARGTVELEPSGWGTKVTLTAQVPETGPGEPVDELRTDDGPTATDPPAEAPSPPPPPPLAPVPDPPDEEPPSDAPPSEPPPQPEPPLPAAATPPAAGGDFTMTPQRIGLLARLFGWGRLPDPPPFAPPPPPPPEPEPEPDPVPPRAAEVATIPTPAAQTPAEPAPEPEPELGAGQTEALLVGALDSLGSAHHRPFSRG